MYPIEKYGKAYFKASYLDEVEERRDRLVQKMQNLIDEHTVLESYFRDKPFNVRIKGKEV